MSAAPQADLLRMGELAARAGVSPATVKHYVQEGVLPEPVRTSRNMAWYPPDFVERIALVRRLREERWMPLRAIRDLLAEEGPERARALLDHERRLADRLLEGDTGARLDRDALVARTDLPAAVVDKLAELDVIGEPVPADAPGDGARGGAARTFDEDDVAVCRAFVAFRAGGFGTDIGFTAHDAVRYVEALGPLAEEEAGTVLRRLAGHDRSPEEAARLLDAARAPLHDLVGALHSRLLRRAIGRRRAGA